MDGLVGTLKRGSGEVSDRLTIYLKSGDFRRDFKQADRQMSVQGSPQNTDHSVLTSCHKIKNVWTRRSQVDSRG